MKRVALGCAAALIAASTAFAQKDRDAETSDHSSSTPPSTAGSGAWRVADTASTLDGSHNYLAYVQSDAPVYDAKGHPKSAALTISCNSSGFFFTFDWPDRIDAARGQLTADLVWKLDDGPPQRSAWFVTPKALLEPGRSGLAWAKRWSGGKTLVVRVPDRHAGQEATFQITGLDQVVAEVSRLNCG